MFHTAVYTASVAAGATDADLPGLTDQAITLSNNHFVFTQPAQVIGAYVLGATVTRAKIQTPKTRALANPYIRPVEALALPVNRPNFADLSRDTILLNPIDETQILISNTAGAPERESVVVWFSDGNLNAPQGNTFTVRATTAFSSTTLVWTAGVFTLDSVLPAGTYSVVGMNAIAANLICARLIFPLQVWRPGCIAQQSVGQYPGDYFQRGYLGEWGRFASIAQPQVELFSSGVAANPEIYLDLVKVG